MFKFILCNFDDNFNCFNSKLTLSKDKYLRDISLDEDLNDLNVEPLSISPIITFYDNFIKKRKSSNNTFNKLHFHLIRESINFKYNFYKNLSDISKISKLNLNLEEFSFFKKYVKEKPFKVIDCDKNVGLCLLKSELYNDFVLEQLNNNIIYEFISVDPLNSTIILIKDVLFDLYKSKDLVKNLYDKLVPNVKSCKLGSFRLLAKLHKSKLGFRPIINCINHPTSSLSLLVDCILQPFVKISSSFIQDSQNLIQITENLIFPSDAQLYSCDFEGLYTNIDLKHALIVISEFVLSNFNSRLISAKGFHVILQLVFENNIFSFGDNSYRQITGIAMGSKCGPSVANIYISLLEQSFLFIHKPLLYYRFIDDILIICGRDFDIQILIRTFTYLTLNIVTSDKVVFLDLIIKLEHSTGHLVYSLYNKPTCTFSYLLYNSNHPGFIFDNIPKSLYIRIRRICSNFSDFLLCGSKLLSQLVSRGYNRLKVIKTFMIVAKIDRNSLIAYKDKSLDKLKLNNTIYFKFPFDSNINKIMFAKSFNTASNELVSSKYFCDKKIRVVNNMQQNFLTTFVHNSQLNVHVNHKYNKCLSKTCRVCKFSNCASYLRLNEFYLPILSFSSCDSKYVVYIIKCNCCDSYYIGQTESLLRRLNTHIRSCKLNLISLSTNCS